MPTLTGWATPETVATVTGGDGERPWLDLNNVKVDDANFAHVDNLDTKEDTDELWCTNYIWPTTPTGIITGIYARYRRRASASNELFGYIFRTIVGGVISGDNKDDGSVWATTNETITAGGDADLWGLLSLSVEAATASNFGVVIATNNHPYGVAAIPRIELVEMQLAFLADTPGGEGGYPNGIAMPMFTCKAHKPRT